MTDYSSVLQALDADSAEKTERVRQMIRDAGRLDLLEEFDRNMREVRNGTSTARSAWHSISPAQRRVLEIMEPGHSMHRRSDSSRYDAMSLGYMECVGAGIKTMRALCAHSLVHVDGGATDPEAKFVLTERGRFVLKHGRPA